MSKVFKYPQCGCCFPVVEDITGTRILFDPNIENLPMDCVATWDLISEGNTKGVFQLESRWGQTLAARLKPRNIEHLAALTSIMRPGCSDAKREGKSITDHYIDRKNGVEEVTYFHPALKDALEQTYGEMVYQEQAMQIARDIAGFDLKEADVLRKAIGKKKADIMAKVKMTFMQGCRTQGIVTDEQAEEIFSWIEKSQRYSFNKSHAVSYAVNAYLSAYAKAHFKRSFFTSYLYFSKEKQKPHQEIKELVNNARSMDVEVLGPDFRKMNEHFKLIEKDIYFGLTDIKNVGKAVFKKLEKLVPEVEINLKAPIDTWTWIDFLMFVSHLNRTAVESLVKTGAMSWTKLDRQLMWFEFELWSKLTEREQEWLRTQYLMNGRPKDVTFEKLLQVLLNGETGKNGGIATEPRRIKVAGLLNLCQNPPETFKDSPEWIAAIEEALLGIPLTCSVVEACDTSAANATCRDFMSGQTSKDGIIIAAKIDKIKPTKTKNGKNPGQDMGFLTVSDNTGLLESVVLFPEPWKANKPRLFENNTVMLIGSRGKEKDSFVVGKVLQI